MTTKDFDHESNYQPFEPTDSTPIFTVMNDLAQKYSAYNLSAGISAMNIPDAGALCRSFQKCISDHEGVQSRYAPSIGDAGLRNRISELILELYSRTVCPEKEVTITSGASEALYLSIRAFIKAGDEVLLFDPSYPCFTDIVSLCGGKAAHIPMRVRDQHFEFDWDAMRKAVTQRTRAIIINTPHNPTGRSFNKPDWQALELILSEWPSIYLISDEVYEFINFSNPYDSSASCYPSIYQRCCIISSLGKTFSLAGLDIGYIVAPEKLTNPLRNLHYYVTASSAGPLQCIFKDLLNKNEIDKVLVALREQRELVRQRLAKSRFRVLPCEATFYQLLDYKLISDLPNPNFCEWMIKNHGVAATPLCAFYHTPIPNDAKHIIRICFARTTGLVQPIETLSQL